jgi:hypothetical protein
MQVTIEITFSVDNKIRFYVQFRIRMQGVLKGKKIQVF